ncbi:unnamed protein product [Prorocentrum cordatum]|uniref:Uncharacterized protein n=1 Tax=Prorocentrum cordatum TaxID=2364126 RepID=A0ABN9UVR1_9DINO|nr:unnamed protein product [Polarella glacialis]
MPWDGGVSKTLHVANKRAKERADAEAAFHRLSQETARLEYEIGEGVALAGAAAAGEEGAPAGAQALAAAAADLERHRAAARDLLCEAERAAEAEPSALSEALRDLVGRLQATAGSVAQALEALHAAREAAEDEERQREAESQDQQVVDAILVEASELTSRAEDMVEKAEITWDMISSCGDDEDVIRQAVQDTTASAGEAQAAVARARAFLDAKLPEWSRLCSRAAKERAAKEMQRLRQQLSAGQQRLGPLKSAWQDWEKGVRGQKAAAEATRRLASAEAEADRAEAAVALLRDGTPAKEALAGAMSQLRAAEEQVESTMRFLDAKGRGAEGLDIAELPDLQQQGAAARERLRGLRAAVRQAEERDKARGHLQEASSRVASVTKDLNDLLEAGATDVGPCEAACASVKTALRMARTCLQMKLVEVRRFSEVVEAEATAELKGMQQELEEPSARLTELLGTISRQRLEGVAKGAEASVVSVEALVAALREAASLLADGPATEAMSAEQLRQAVARVTEREREATRALTEARRFVASKQLEARGRIGEAEAQAEAAAVFARLQARLADGQAEIARHRRLPGSIDRQLAGRKAVAEAEERLAGAAEKVSGAAAAAARYLEAEGARADLQREAERSVQEAQIDLRTVLRLVAALSRLEGCSREAIARLETAARGAQERADDLGSRVRERAESALCGSLLQEACRGVELCEAAAEQAALAEVPLAAGLDSLPAEQASDAIENLERAVQAAQTQLLATRTLVSMKRVATRRFSEAARGAAAGELDGLQGRTEAVSQKLAEMRSRAAELKRSAVRKEACSR